MTVALVFSVKVFMVCANFVIYKELIRINRSRMKIVTGTSRTSPQDSEIEVYGVLTSVTVVKASSTGPMMC